ncbi:hypothetical protein [Pontibacter anaerobius]|uniref:Uncharacterized protein n=1 Tax=Pontibacter anaerobius TaxID=2993940 RepID=A0ABT3RAX5_9BACT|nr:hypothetical protein [Pontibacter anaerobius]MCX2738588.1 hypothetical protein [Pontibacter anaerobius]
MQKLKLYFLYHKSLMSFSIPFSLLIGVVSMAFSEEMAIGFINSFSLSLLTGSFILSLYFYEQRYQHQYYFYHNLGISKAGLILGSYLFNLALALLLFTLKVYLYA